MNQWLIRKRDGWWQLISRRDGEIWCTFEDRCRRPSVEDAFTVFRSYWRMLFAR